MALVITLLFSIEKSIWILEKLGFPREHLIGVCLSSLSIYRLENNGMGWQDTQIAEFMGPTWDPLGTCRPQMGPMLSPINHALGVGSRDYDVWTHFKNCWSLHRPVRLLLYSPYNGGYLPKKQYGGFMIISQSCFIRLEQLWYAKGHSVGIWFTFELWKAMTNNYTRCIWSHRLSLGLDIIIFQSKPLVYNRALTIKYIRNVGMCKVCGIC